MPWLGKDRVNVQVTATLDDSETRQTVEQVRNVEVDGKSRPQEKIVRTTREPEGRIQRINAIVILGFDASANERWKAGQMARQALGLAIKARRQSARLCHPGRGAGGARAGSGLRLTAHPQIRFAASRLEPVSIPQVHPRNAPPPQADRFPELSPWWLLAGAGVLLVGVMGWRARRRPAPELPVEDFDAELEAIRNQVQADPRVTADVIKLWMRA